MSDFFTLSFRPDIALTVEGDRSVRRSPQHSLTLENPQPGLRTALEHLLHSTQTVSQLQAVVAQLDGVEASLNFESELQKLISLGWISHSVLPLATAIAIAENYQFVCPVFDWQQPLMLSRFAFLRQENQQFVLESPMSEQVIFLDKPNLEALAKTDISLTQAIESRQSIYFLNKLLNL